MDNKYSVHMIDANGNGFYLSVKGRTSWGKPTAKRHAHDMQTLINKGKGISGAITVDIENQFGEIIAAR